MTIAQITDEAEPVATDLPLGENLSAIKGPMSVDLCTLQLSQWALEHAPTNPAQAQVYATLALANETQALRKQQAEPEHVIPETREMYAPSDAGFHLDHAGKNGHRGSSQATALEGLKNIEVSRIIGWLIAKDPEDDAEAPRTAMPITELGIATSFDTYYVRDDPDAVIRAIRPHLLGRWQWAKDQGAKARAQAGAA